MKYHLIVNPTSGRGAGAASIPAIREQMARHGLEYTLEETARPMHAVDLARQAAGTGADVVVSAGGDGTANEVLNGLMQAREADPAGFKTAMGVICVGRGNDFAFGMGLPAGLEEACAVLAAGRRKRVDVGCARGGDYPNGRYFGNGVGIGFDAVVGFEAAKMTRLSGLPNYLVAALKTIFLYFKAPQVRIESSAGNLETSALMVSIMNGRRMGGGFMMAPEGQPSDGLLDACIVRQVNKGRIFQLIPHFMKGTQAGEAEVTMQRTARITVTALQGSLPAHADGETLCTAGEQLSIELLPGALEMIVPAGGAG